MTDDDLTYLTERLDALEDEEDILLDTLRHLADIREEQKDIRAQLSANAAGGPAPKARKNQSPKEGAS